MARNETSFVNFSLTKELCRAEDAGVISPNMPIKSEYEENHLSELERIFEALDEVEDYVAVYTLVKYRKSLLIRILEYMNKEGETT
jgi:hypothetical protein